MPPGGRLVRASMMHLEDQQFHVLNPIIANGGMSSNISASHGHLQAWV